MDVDHSASLECGINAIEDTSHGLYRGDSSIYNWMPVPVKLSPNRGWHIFRRRQIILKRLAIMVSFGRFHQANNIGDACVHQSVDFFDGGRRRLAAWIAAGEKFPGDDPVTTFERSEIHSSAILHCLLGHWLSQAIANLRWDTAFPTFTANF